MNRIFAIPVMLVSLFGAAVAQPCPCDCDADRTVRVHELSLGVNVALDRMNVDRCRAADRDSNSKVEIAELLSGVGAALHGCAPPLPSPTPVPDGRPSKAELDAARALWTAAGYNHYEARYFLGCFCFGPHDVVIEVLDGEVIEIRNPETGQAIDVDHASLFMTVDQLFDRIEAELTTADRIDVEFDPTTGHPTDYSADPVFELADEELSVRISNLQPIESTCSSFEDCDGFIEICVEPGGFAGCGACFDTAAECETDDQCGGNARICEPVGHTAQSCACDSSVLVCKPGCRQDTECPSGSACGNDHHCTPTRCTGDESCPAQFECQLPPDSRTGECRRRNCAGPTECPDGGFCVNQQCYPRPGRCDVVPP